MSKCSAQYPCWQHYGEHQKSQPPVAWVITLAASALHFRVAQMHEVPTDEQAEKVLTAAQRLQSLLNTRWRNCVREPFQFAPYAAKAVNKVVLKPATEIQEELW